MVILKVEINQEKKSILASILRVEFIKQNDLKRMNRAKVCIVIVKMFNIE